MGLFRTIYLEIRDILGMAPPAETPEQAAETLASKLKEQRGGKVTRGEDAYVLNTKIGDRAVTVEFSVAGAAAAFKTTCRIKRPDFGWQVTHESALDDDPSMQRATLSAGLVVEGADGALLADQKDGWTRLTLSGRSALTKLVTETAGTLWYEGGTLELIPSIETLSGRSGSFTADKQLGLFIEVADGIDQGWGG